MRITASVKSAHQVHEATLTTNDASKSLTLPVRASGYGSAANGGELLLLALATP